MITEAGELADGRPYAERSEREPSFHDKAAEFLLGCTVRPARQILFNSARGLASIVPLVRQYESTLARTPDADLVARAGRMRGRLRKEGFSETIVAECFALVCEVASRTIGKRHFDAQLMAGWALLQGTLIEMETGEGKTIAATLAASTVALAGYPVHVITVNDYLAERDAEEMGPLYRYLRLSVGVVVQGQTREVRRKAYANSVTYCTNKELAFDYLRDRVALANRGSRLHLSLEKICASASRESELVLRGLYFGIVDEADSIFIDEARTPLILSATAGASEAQEQCARALEIAAGLDSGRDYLIELVERRVSLTAAGRERLGELAHKSSGVWTSVRAREELVTQALSALHLFRRDQHYVVSEGKVQIVDESTGRVMPDRSWEGGLHQMIEAKERCELTLPRETLARLTYQRLFRRYIRLAGMTGTASEVAREIRSVYGLDVVRIPLHRPSRRKYVKPLVFRTREEKWRAVANSVERLAIKAGRPVLIGTRSVKASEEISAVLTERGIEHALLNAKQDQFEADVVALAGQPNRVTVATNMAGRGTDIRLGPGVAERGGLHVILTEYHESRRIDRQFFGRCARQGDPGSCEAIVSLDDEIYVVYAPTETALVARVVMRAARASAALYQGLRGLAQFRAERRGAYIRLQNLAQDRRLERVLAFSGRAE
ncbi:preprotein translocase subunit SecA [Bradyrhizobium sp. CCBAU 53340]|uniref:preprotein translocase subunit SecA n=1 Tax=Bradyrhizobium sp. CCBAU 53340 TaxID=1325112 RepID=UPI00188B8AB4|nr:preprotein translocase subunit SecA [Bradyrhizobium sp. CCBAU 53340]